MYISLRKKKYIVSRGWDGFFTAFWQTFTYKYLPNIIWLCFHFVKFSWEKYNMLGADEDGQMILLHNELLVYIFKYKWNRETTQFLDKNFNFVQFNHKNHCCNVSLSMMMKRWKHNTPNTLNCRKIFFQLESSGKIYLEAFNFSLLVDCFNKENSEKVVKEKYFSHITDKSVPHRRNSLKALVIMSLLLLLFLLLFLLIIFISLAFNL